MVDTAYGPQLHTGGRQAVTLYIILGCGGLIGICHTLTPPPGGGSVAQAQSAASAIVKGGAAVAQSVAQVRSHVGHIWSGCSLFPII